MTEMTEREIDIIEMLSIGYNNLQIANETGLARGTIKKHLDLISKKLNAHGRAGIVGEAYRKGILKTEQQQLEK